MSYYRSSSAILKHPVCFTTPLHAQPYTFTIAMKWITNRSYIRSHDGDPEGYPASIPPPKVDAILVKFYFGSAFHRI